MIICVVVVVLASGALLWQSIHTGLHDAVTQVGEIRDLAPIIKPIPTDSPTVDAVPTHAPNESTEGAQATEEITPLSNDLQGLRARKFLLERYYPDLQKEAGFGSEDVDNLLRLKGSSEAELEEGLGPEKYYRWKEYEAKVQSKTAVSSLGRALSGSDQLRDDQADMLYRTIFEEHRRRDEELRVRGYSAPADPRLRLEFEFANLEIKEGSNRRLISAAQSFLTDKQLAALLEAVVDPNLAEYRKTLERFRTRMESQGTQ